MEELNVMAGDIFFYCFKEGLNQESKVVKCGTILAANQLFNEELKKLKNNTNNWTYFDITIDGKMYRNSNRDTKDMELYDVSFLKNGVYQSNLVNTSKNPAEIKLYYKENKPNIKIIGISITTSDDIKPSKPIITI